MIEIDAFSACRLLEWDTEFFGLRIARLREPLPGETRSELLSVAASGLGNGSLDCLCALLPADDEAAATTAGALGLRNVDARVTLVADSKALEPLDAATVDNSEERRSMAASHDDLPTLRAIARGAHRDSRFYADPGFDDRACDALYEAWIENSVRGWADFVLVAKQPGSNDALGYITGHVDRETGTSQGEAPERSVGRIGLFAVAAAARKQGVGRQLQRAALSAFQEADCTTLSVATQARNTGAIASYRAMGFREHSTEQWWHGWSADRRKASSAR